MKLAYVSVVIPVFFPPDISVIAGLDTALDNQARAHEIIIVIVYGVSIPNYQASAKTGPITIITTHSGATQDEVVVAGLARAAGDFIIEWRSGVDLLRDQILEQILIPTDAGVELVEVTGVNRSITSRVFTRLVNILRPSKSPIRKTIGRVYSRHALSEILSATAVEPHIDILIAELPVRRTVESLPIAISHRDSWMIRITDGLTLLSKGTRFGSRIPLILAGISAIFGIVATFYAFIFLLRGGTPQGWTTLMAVVGLGQAAVLTMLGLIWTRIDSLTRGLARNPDVTAEVKVIPPTETQEFKKRGEF